MKYFVLALNKRFDAAPIIMGASQKIDTRYINTESASKLPQRELLFVDAYMGGAFPDVFSFPLFLVSEKVFDVIKMYEPGAVSKQVILLDGKYAQSGTYFLPILKSVDCIHPDTGKISDWRYVERLVLERDKLCKEAIFRPAGVSHAAAVVRLDLAESILKRGAKGIGLMPVEIK